MKRKLRILLWHIKFIWSRIAESYCLVFARGFVRLLYVLAFTIIVLKVRSGVVLVFSMAQRQVSPFPSTPSSCAPSLLFPSVDIIATVLPSLRWCRTFSNRINDNFRHTYSYDFITLLYLLYTFYYRFLSCNIVLNSHSWYF